uniref:Ribosomal protein S19 n=1 Tax=Oltmannsiellopsis viridis TaxID=51324 RepID=Q0QIR8_OLTVI|nr:ribosomal protein S19 [Oltmannsiellopsis viridis]ABC96336.1 ribosomal protein S19 [Oltmannsiellopsis viridis]
MTRSTWKGPVIRKESLTRGKGFKTLWSRDSTILPSLVNKQYKIFNGKRFIRFRVTEETIGHKFGEFASTRKKLIFKRR